VAQEGMIRVPGDLQYRVKNSVQSLLLKGAGRPRR
jgi:hypothetical protein